MQVDLADSNRACAGGTYVPLPAVMSPPWSMKPFITCMLPVVFVDQSLRYISTAKRLSMPTVQYQTVLKGCEAMYPVKAAVFKVQRFS